MRKHVAPAYMPTSTYGRRTNEYQQSKAAGPLRDQSVECLMTIYEQLSSAAFRQIIVKGNIKCGIENVPSSC